MHIGKGRQGQLREGRAWEGRRREKKAKDGKRRQRNGNEGKGMQVRVDKGTSVRGCLSASTPPVSKPGVSRMLLERTKNYTTEHCIEHAHDITRQLSTATSYSFIVEWPLAWI